MKNYLLLVPFSIAGLISLFFIAKTSIPQRGSLSEIDSSSVGKTVSVTGKIISKKVHSAGHVFLTISDADSMSRSWSLIYPSRDSLTIRSRLRQAWLIFYQEKK